MEKEELLDAYDSGYHNYKDIKIQQINEINLKSFRTIKDRKMELGKVITVVSGKNGTMKSTILGLIAHPFSSPNNAKDVFGNPLKTKHSDVFYLSPDKDSEQYIYSLVMTSTDGIDFEEPIRVYKRANPDGTFRHRVTVGKDNVEGKGNFSLNTSYVNLKRLIPMIDTRAKIVDETIEKSLSEFVADGYMKVLQKNAFSEPVEVFDRGRKQTFGPGRDAKYDYNAISSGEDNVGHILSKMHAFLQYKSNNRDELQGIFCIDEMEASLHPVAQINMFNYIYDWTKNNHIQVVINTHSLYLIQYVFELQERLKNRDDVVLNMISTAYVKDDNYNIIKNPSYSEAYKELTLKDIGDVTGVYKINIICEDDVAENYLKRIISKKEILSRLVFMHSLNEDVEGNSCTGLTSLIKNGQKLLEDTIIFFDADVDTSKIKNLERFFMVLPGLHGLPLEKEIAKYIYDLPGDDLFFKAFKREKMAFQNDFAQYELHLEDVDVIKAEKVSKYKNWAKSNEKEFKKYVTYYVKNNKLIMDDFMKKLSEKLNDIFENKGLPGVTL